MNRSFNHFRHRLKERYNIDLTVEECEELTSQIEKGIYLKADLNNANYTSIAITLMIKGQLLTVAYIPEVKYIATCLRLPRWHKDKIRDNPIIEFQKWDVYLNRLKENNIRIEKLCLSH